MRPWEVLLDGYEVEALHSLSEGLQDALHDYRMALVRKDREDASRAHDSLAELMAQLKKVWNK